MPALFATLLLASLALAAAIAFAPQKARSRLKWLLIAALAFAWVAMGIALAQIVSRTATTLVTPGGARQPHLIDQAAREGLMLLASLGLPALIATVLGWLALKATRPGSRQAPP